MSVDSVDSYSKIQENRVKYKELFDKSGSNDMINTETFFSLLMAEMTNQDPLEPMSNTEFVSQMAQFTALQTQKDNLYYSNASYASSLVGKTVTVAESKDSEIVVETGVVTGLELTDEKFNITVNGKQYLLSNIMKINSAEEYKAETAVVDAANLIGKHVTIEVKGETEEEILYENGIVQSVEVQDGTSYVVVNDYAYKISDIVQVKSAPASDENTENSDKDTDEQVMDMVNGK